jgi:hypothetical protein
MSRWTGKRREEASRGHAETVTVMSETRGCVAAHGCWQRRDVVEEKERSARSVDGGDAIEDLEEDRDRVG